MVERQVLVFSLDEGEYGVPVGEVKGIIKYGSATVLPNTHDHVEDVINLRNKLIPIVELGEHLGLRKRTKTDRMAVIVEVAGREFGIVVDTVSEVMTLQENAIEPVPDAMTKTSHIFGIGKEKDRLIILLNLSPCLNKTNRRKLMQAMLRNLKERANAGLFMS